MGKQELFLFSHATLLISDLAGNIFPGITSGDLCIVKQKIAMKKTASVILQWVTFFWMVALFQIDLQTARAADIYEDSFGYSKNIRLDTRSGYRKGNLNWNIAAPDYSPNILSELQYDDLTIYEAGFDVKAVVNKLYSKASISFGKIAEGTGTDSDYQENDRNSIYSQSESSLSDEIQDLSIGFGYQVDFLKNRLLVAPHVGLSYHTQKIRQTDGIQTITLSDDLPPPSSREISGLNSTYESNWRTVFAGFDLDCEIIYQIHMIASIEYHTASFKAYADWNLRDDFAHPVSFMHEADGQGTSMNVGINRLFAERWLIGLTYGWQVWDTDPGTDTLYWSGGGATRSTLNEVNWESRSVNLSIGYNF